MDLYRVKEVKRDDKWVWTAQYRLDGRDRRWKPCLDREGNPVYRDNPSSARHWLFWEGGYDRYPDAGTTDSTSVRCFDRNGTRWMSFDERMDEERDKKRREEADRAAAESLAERQEILFTCDCGDINHQFVMVYDKHEGEEEREVFVEIKLNPLPFWKRLVHGIKYIFGYKSRFGDFGEVILNGEHAEKLMRVAKILKTGGQ